MTFAKVLSAARKKAGLSQKELAALIKKEDGHAISPQYVNDLEFGRRNPPPPLLLEQLATVLNVPTDVFYYWAGTLPADIREVEADAEQVVAAYQAFRREIRRD